MKFFFAAFFSIFCVATVTAQQTPMRFGFQELKLDMQLAQVPQKYKTDCGSGGDKKYLFCRMKTDVGVVPMNFLLSFTDERLSSIEAHFPTEHFDAVWLALREKHGKENSRTNTSAEWLAFPRVLGEPNPDVLTLRKMPTKERRPDGKYFLPDVRYSIIEIESFWEANEAMRKMQEAHDQKVKGIAEKL